MEHRAVTIWIADYEQAWRTPGTEALARLFTPEVSYRASPWAEPIVGLERLGEFWESEREGAEEPFELRSEVVAVEGDTAVARIFVEYTAEPGAPGERWRDLWVLRFAPAADGRCSAFEEWPFAPGQHDGHEHRDD